MYRNFSLLIVMLLTGCTKTTDRQISIIPVPQEIIRHKGTTTIRLPLGITIGDPELLPVVEVFRSNLKQLHSINSAIDRNGMLQIIIDPSIESTEGYKLAIRHDKIRLSAKTSAGAFYGLQSLIQICMVSRQISNN